MESLTFNIPDKVAIGEMKITAKLYYSKLVASVGEFLKVPAEEYTPILVNEHSTNIMIVD